MLWQKFEHLIKFVFKINLICFKIFFFFVFNFQIDVVRKLCLSSRSNSCLNNKQQSTNLPELIVNPTNEIEKEKTFNSNQTQTISIEDEQIGDDIEIIPANIQDDFVQLDLNECNEQS